MRPIDTCTKRRHHNESIEKNGVWWHFGLGLPSNKMV